MVAKVQKKTINEPNPFRISEEDLDVQHRGKETTHAERGSAGEQRLKIWEKCTTAERNRAEWIQELLNATDKEDEEQKQNQEDKDAADNNRLSRIMERLEKYIGSKGNQDDKETLTEFISKKREIFLLQMSLNIKKEEIRKLDEKAKAKEEALEKSEEALEDDALRFDVFLKENDKKAQDAIRMAEKETKNKMEKVQEIKKLNQELQVVQSAINKHKSGLEECLRFKSFLEELTPSEWVDEQADTKRKRQTERRRTRIEARQREWKQEQQEKLDLIEKVKKEAEATSKNRKGRSRRPKDETPPAKPKQMLPSMPDFDDEELNSSDEDDVQMYFDASQQLLDIFSALEEENLFLIQNTQEAEQSLDEMTGRFVESKAEVQKKADTMQDDSNQIKRSIENRQGNIDAMKARIEGKNSGSQNTEQHLMNDLAKKVKSAYQICGFSFAGATPSTLHMLAEIEAKMENVLSSIQPMPEPDFKRANKAKEKKRRQTKRAQQQAEQLRLQEDRNKKAIARSMQPPKKQQGKRVSQ